MDQYTVDAMVRRAEALQLEDGLNHQSLRVLIALCRDSDFTGRFATVREELCSIMDDVSDPTTRQVRLIKCLSELIDIAKKSRDFYRFPAEQVVIQGPPHM